MLTHQDVFDRAEAAAKWLRRFPPGVYKAFPYPRRSIPAAYAILAALATVPGNRHSFELTDSPDTADVIIGTFAADLVRFDRPGVALIDEPVDGKVVLLPWETAPGVSSAPNFVVDLLRFIGEDPGREGLKETPTRVMKAWKEWASGYEVDIPALFKTFEDGAERCDEMVMVSNIPVISKCEHHLADIVGTAHVAYVPRGKIIGLSKIARVVNAYARRLQVQERLTNQIADAMDQGLSPLGVGVIIRARHACMSSRGAMVPDSITTTSALRGVMRTSSKARTEFLSLCLAADQATSR